MGSRAGRVHPNRAEVETSARRVRRPELARRYVAAPDGPDGEATRQTVEVVFATLHRLLGVGIGEHLGYLLTGVWTLARRGLDPLDDRAAGVARRRRLPIGVALLIGARVRRPNERDGWRAGGYDRADRLHRVVGLAHRPRGVPDPVADDRGPIGGPTLREPDASETSGGETRPNKQRSTRRIQPEVRLDGDR